MWSKIYWCWLLPAHRNTQHVQLTHKNSDWRTMQQMKTVFLFWPWAECPSPPRSQLSRFQPGPPGWSCWPDEELKKSETLNIDATLKKTSWVLTSPPRPPTHSEHAVCPQGQNTNAPSRCPGWSSGLVVFGWTLWWRRRATWTMSHSCLWLQPSCNQQPITGLIYASGRSGVWAGQKK